MLSFTSLRRLRAFSALSSFLFFVAIAAAHAAPVAGSVAKVQLTGHIPTWASVAGDLGVLPDTEMTNLTVVLQRPAGKKLAFDKLVQGISDPKSPNFHHFLTPAETAQYGPTAAEVESMKSWLTAQGMTVTEVSHDRTRITFNGTSNAIAKAFGTEFHNYKVHGKDGPEVRFSVNANPSVPVELASNIAAVSGLVSEILESDDHATETILGKNHHVMTPATFGVQYGLTSIVSGGYNGAGVRVAVIGQTLINPQDITDFQTQMGLNVNAQPNIIVPPLGSTPTSTDIGENTLDVNRVMSTAPNAWVDLVTSGDTNALMTAASYNVNTLVDPIMTMSYGGCETDYGQAVVNSWDSLFQTAAAEGITVIVSSGDSGAVCGNAWDNMNPNAGHPNIPSSGLTAGINYLCASTWVTCVGGTTLVDTASPSTYWTDSGTTFSTLKGYVPEGAFNEPVDPSGYNQIGGSNGGSSAYIARPSYQGQTAMSTGYLQYAGTDTGRMTPDIALTASGHDGYFQCLNLDCENGHFSTEEGTSAAAPGFAGIMALIVQTYGKQGGFNGVLYNIGYEGSYQSAFHPISIASSGVTTCVAGTPSLCNNSEPGATSQTSGGVTGFTLSSNQYGGYSKVTGIGSVNVGNLISFNINGTNSRGYKVTDPQGLAYPWLTTTATYPSQTAFSWGTTLTSNLNATVKTGTADVTSLGTNMYTATNSVGLETVVTTATVLDPGTYTLRLYYQPTAANAATVNVASATASLKVNQLTATNVVSANSLTTTVNTNDTLTATVTSTKLLSTDTVQFYDGATKIGTAQSLTSGVAALTNYQFATATTHSITAAYSGNTYVAAKTSSAISVVVSKATTATVSLQSSATTVTPATSVTLTATVGGATLVSGDTVQFYDGSTALGSAVSVNTTTGVATLTGQTFNPGAHNITATFGDASYATATSSIVTITASKLTTATVALQASATSVGPTTSVTLTATVGTATLVSGDTVQFYDGSTALGSPVSANKTTGIATLTGQTFTAGQHPITATFGDANYSTVTSNTVTITSVPPAPTLTGPTTSLTITAPGGATTGAITITSNGGLAGSVGLTCVVTAANQANVTDLPTCSIAPNIVTLTAGSTSNATITINTTSPYAVHGGLHAGLERTLGGGVLACMFLLMIPRRRRMGLALMLLLGLGFGGLAGCSNSNPGLTNPGTTAGGYTVTVTATYNTTSTVTSTFTLTVN